MKNILKKYQTKNSFDFIVAQKKQVGREKTHIHKILIKTKNALTIQVKIEMIKFVNFFHKRRIFEIELTACLCDYFNQTTKHVIMFCCLNDIKKRLFNVKISDDYRRLINDQKPLKIIISLLMKTEYLNQFSTAVQQLYNQ